MASVKVTVSLSLLMVLSLYVVPAQAEGDDTFRHLGLQGPDYPHRLLRL